MIKILFIFFTIFTYSLNANEKVIKDMVKNYKVNSLINELNLSEKELDLLCGSNHLSSDCEIKSIYLENEIRKKRISYLLDEIAKKYDLDKVITSNLKINYIKYIEINEKIYGLSSYCSSNICSMKSIWVQLLNFEECLKFILNGNINKNLEEDYIKSPKNNFSLNNLDNLYSENVEIIDRLKNSQEFNYKSLKMDFTNIHKFWKNYEKTLREFLKKTNKYNEEWIELFYGHRFNHLEISKEFFKSHISAY